MSFTRPNMAILSTIKMRSKCRFYCQQFTLHVSGNISENFCDLIRVCLALRFNLDFMEKIVHLRFFVVIFLSDEWYQFQFDSNEMPIKPNMVILASRDTFCYSQMLARCCALNPDSLFSQRSLNFYISL